MTMHILARDVSEKKRLPEMMTHSTPEQLAFDESITPATRAAWADITTAYVSIKQTMLSLSLYHKDIKFTLESHHSYLNGAEVNRDNSVKEEE
jgi:hypothetical protein